MRRRVPKLTMAGTMRTCVAVWPDKRGTGVRMVWNPHSVDGIRWPTSLQGIATTPDSVYEYGAKPKVGA